MGKNRTKRKIVKIPQKTIYLKPEQHKKIHLNPDQKLAGFAINSVLEGEQCKVCCKIMLTSDSPNFHSFTQDLYRIFFSRPKDQFVVFEPTISQFLVVVHEDSTADVYWNDKVSVKTYIRLKNSCKAGQFVNKDDVIDINSVSFEGVQLLPTDKIVCCLKDEWRFGLYFDLCEERELDPEVVYKDLASMMKVLRFGNTLDFLKDSIYLDIKAEGWFPFVELLTTDWEHLCSLYKNEEGRRNDITERLIKKFLDGFDKKRIEKIFERWQGKQFFNDRETFLRAGIDAFLQDDKSGFINAITTLTTQTDGIIRSAYTTEHPNLNSDIKFKDLTQFILDKGSSKAFGAGQSMFLEQEFFNYLNSFWLKHFKPNDASPDPSRHSIGHGVISNPEVYDKALAIKTILILDQIFFYL